MNIRKYEEKYFENSAGTHNRNLTVYKDCNQAVELKMCINNGQDYEMLHLANKQEVENLHFMLGQLLGK